MRYRGSNGRLEGFKNHSTRFVLLLLVIALLSFVPRAARTPQQTRKRPISAPEILAVSVAWLSFTTGKPQRRCFAKRKFRSRPRATSEISCTPTSEGFGAKSNRSLCRKCRNTWRVF